MRKKIIIGNWKMNKTLSETKDFINTFNNFNYNKDIDVGFAIPFVNLANAQELAKNSIIIAAQNCFCAPNGAFTGEISIAMLQAINVKYVIVGHSERRIIFHESDELINEKVIALVNNQMTPILCCGETLKQYEENLTKEVVSQQINKALINVTAKQAEGIVIAYEPIWAIGTGKTATSIIAQEVCSFIRKQLCSIYDSNTAEKIRIQYGGSVNEKNAHELLKQADIDGALVGGASLNPNTFLQLLV